MYIYIYIYVYIYITVLCFLRTRPVARFRRRNPEPGGPGAESTATAAKVGPRGQPACSPKRRCPGRPAKLPDATPTGCSDPTSVRPTFAVCEGIARIGA